MKIFDLLPLALLTTRVLFVSADIDTQVLSVQTPDGERAYRVYTPKNTPITSLLLTLHGFGESSDTFLWYTDFRKYANKYGYEIILPQAIGIDGSRSWNAGGCCFPKYDDISYIKSAIEARRKVHGNVPVYGYGFSNGGMLTEVLMCEGVVQRGVSASGVLTIGPGGNKGLDVCDEKMKEGNQAFNRSLLVFHGSVDGIVPWSGVSLFGSFPQKWNSFDRWAKRLGCSSQDEKVWTGWFTWFWRLPCPKESNNQLVFYNVQGASHWVHLDWRDIYKVYTEDVSVKFLYEGIEPY
ncbi:hypothetical protein FOL47_010700, partial [Perkinsus chesapeaki]